MYKRGQVAVFVIVGVVLVFALVLLFVFRTTLREGFKESVNKQEYLNSEINQITKVIDECVNKESKNAFKIFGNNGGYFDPVDYVSYYGNKISVICDNVKDKKYCNAKPLSKEDSNKRLSIYIKKKLDRCIDIDDFKDRNYKFEDKDLNVDVKINIEEVYVNVIYPIVLTYENAEVKKNNFSKKIKIPLGKAMSLANFIASQRAKTGDFDVISYSLLSRGDFTIREREIFPNTFYIIDFPNKEYKFNLAIEEEA